MAQIGQKFGGFLKGNWDPNSKTSKSNSSNISLSATVRPQTFTWANWFQGIQILNSREWKENILFIEKVNKMNLFLPGIEPGTFCVLDRCDNHYTTKTWWVIQLNFKK